MNGSNSSFVIKDCSIATIATGLSAGSLIDFRDKLLTIPLSSIYYHFWIARLKPHFVHSGYHNDFAWWLHEILREEVAAEQLSILDPLRFESLEELRTSIIDILDRALDVKTGFAWSQRENYFHFVTARMAVVNTQKKMDKPEDLVITMDTLSAGSIFHHFIDSRRRFALFEDDFSIWLKSFGEKYKKLAEQFSLIDVSFLTPLEIKKKLSDSVRSFFLEG